MIGTTKIHYHFKSFPRSNSDKLPFNLKTNSVDAEFELFICGFCNSKNNAKKCQILPTYVKENAN